MKHPLIYLPFLLWFLIGCVGTDFVDEPLGPVPARLALSHASLILLEGESQALSAQVIASDESILEATVSWGSRDLSIATIDESGQLLAVSAGQVWIDVFTPSLQDSLLVTVVVDPDKLAEILVSASQVELVIGDTLQLTTELRSADGSIVADRMISWESTDPEVCSVDENGLVTALSNGLSQITASAEGIASLPLSLMVGGDSLAREGTFVGLNGYNVEGMVVLERSADEAQVIFDTDFLSQSGPGLYVYLSPNSRNVNGGVNLGSLQAQSGMQTYPIPGNVDPDQFDHVLVYCQPFRVPFGSAALQ